MPAPAITCICAAFLLTAACARGVRGSRYTYQGPTVFHYHMVSKNESRAVSPMPRKRTYHSDLHLPWDSLEVALSHIVRTGARRSKYAFKRFPY